MTSLWHASDPNTPISLQTPLLYADRLRIRQPGDAKFALGPHQDGGSVERWEAGGYGRGGVYDAIFRGEWEAYDPYDASGRVAAVTDMYDGLGACSMFRMFQGWLAMSRSAPGQGTLLVNPLLRESTAYALLRPFFRPVQAADQVAREDFLDARNWVFTAGQDMTSDLQGATPGHGQEFPEGMHPHLELEKTMIHMPEVKPGDFVVWHCDSKQLTWRTNHTVSVGVTHDEPKKLILRTIAIHAVDKRHDGTGDSSVLYIPVCPTTEESARYVARQRAAFLAGTPAPDFPGGKGESEHVGRPTEGYVFKYSDPAGVQSIGLEKLVALRDDTPGAKTAIQRANSILGF